MRARHAAACEDGFRGKSVLLDGLVQDLASLGDQPAAGCGQKQRVREQIGDEIKHKKASFASAESVLSAAPGVPVEENQKREEFQPACQHVDDVDNL